MSDERYLQAIQELRHVVERSVARMEAWWASRSLGTQEIYVYKVGWKYPNDLWTAQTRIGEKGQWAIIHDPEQGFWEMWVEGRCLGPFEEHEVDAAMLTELRKHRRVSH